MEVCTVAVLPESPPQADSTAIRANVRKHTSRDDLKDTGNFLSSGKTMVHDRYGNGQVARVLRDKDEGVLLRTPSDSMEASVLRRGLRLHNGTGRAL